jgi:LysR family transcriptional regulator, glycine cleavage system transcriptional activator
MGRRLPPLNALRAFDIAARTRSFTAAAAELHVSQGAVSRHVAQLEAYLGIALFRREPGGARLTTAGSEYARCIGGAFDSVEQATRCAATLAQKRPLRIKLFPSVAIKWLITRLAEFLALHPAVEVSITTTPKFARFDPEEDDFTVQIGNVAQRGVLEERPRHVVQSGLRFGMKFGNSALAYQAAIDGMGVVIAQRELVRDDLASRRPVWAWPLVAANGEAYYLASAADALGNPDVVAFRQWILLKSNVGRCGGGVAGAADRCRWGATKQSDPVCGVRLPRRFAPRKPTPSRLANLPSIATWV